MNIEQETRFKFEIIDEIVHFTFNIEFIDEEFIDSAIAKRREIFNGKEYPMFSDFRKVKNGTRAAREKLSSQEAGEGVIAVAALINPSVQTVIFNFFNSIYKAPAPTKLFTNKKSALKWLEQFKK